MIKYNLNLIYAILKEFDIPKHNYTFTCDSVESYCPSQVKVNNYIVDLLHGASQVCFFCKDLNYVIKIPIFYGEDYYYLDNGEEARTTYKYCGAIDKGDGSNYCEEALITYRNACKHNLKEFFAAIEKVGNWGEVPIYVQEKCELFSSRYDEDEVFYSECSNGLSGKEKRKMKRIEKRKSQIINYCSINKVEVFNWFFQEQIKKQVGNARFLRLMSFIKEFSIDDLHSDNIGYINQNCVLIDYASFED